MRKYLLLLLYTLCFSEDINKLYLEAQDLENQGNYKEAMLLYKKIASNNISIKENISDSSKNDTNNSEYFTKVKENFYENQIEKVEDKFNIKLDIPEFISLTKFRGKQWAFANFQTTSYVLMGNIAYTVNSRYIPNISKELSKMLNLNVVIFADIGDVDFQPSREALAFSEKTIAFLEKFAIKFWEEVLDHFKTDIDEMKRSVPIVAFQRMVLINSACSRALNMRIDNELFGNIDYFYNGNLVLDSGFDSGFLYEDQIIGSGTLVVNGSVFIKPGAAVLGGPY